MIVEQLVPRVAAVDLGELLLRMRRAPRTQATPFHTARLELGDAVSRAIFGHPRSRSFPEMVALAFWLRRAATARLADRFAALEEAGTLRAPRGLAFHVPPTNVDTLFVYSLMTSLLVGNLNVVRLSRDRPTEQAGHLCDVLRGVLDEDRFAGLREELAVISYGHEPEPTAALSIAADVRLLWGGDDAVARVRSTPSGPATHDLTFGDRFSFAVLRATAVVAAGDEQRRELAERLYNDAYWFDQMGCASPRLLVWVGDAADADAARELLLGELTAVLTEKAYALDAGAAIAKLGFMYGALIDRPVTRVQRAGNELLVLGLETLDRFDRSHPGAGLFFDARVDGLADLVGFVERKDQTLVAYGFAREDLTAFARSLHGRGIDRIVPFGEALSFGSLWDGYDLLAELTRAVDVTVPASTY